MDGRGEWLFLFFFFSPGSIDIRHHGLVELSSNVGIIDPEDSASERKGMFEGRVGAPKWRVGRRLERNSQFPSFHVDSVQFKNETMDVLFLTMSDPIQPPRN